MNSILATENIDEDMNIYEVYDVLAENGIDADNYKPLFKDRFFFYDSALKQVVYTDENYNVLYPDVKGADKANWTSLSGKIKEVNVKDVVSKGDTTVSINTAEAFVAVMDAIKEEKSVVEDLAEVKLTADVNLMGASFNFGKVSSNITLTSTGTAENPVEIKGFRTDNTLVPGSYEGERTDYGMGLFPIISSGTVTVENIKFVNAVVGNSNPAIKNSQTGFIAGAVNGGKLVVNNVTFENCYAVGCQKVGLIVGHVQGGEVSINNVKATNCVVEGAAQVAKAIGIVASKSADNVTLTNCDVAGVTAKATTNNAVWTALWSTGGVADKNWNGTTITVNDVHTNAKGDTWSKYNDGTTNQLCCFVTQGYYWVGGANTTDTAPEGLTGNWEATAYHG